MTIWKNHIWHSYTHKKVVRIWRFGWIIYDTHIRTKSCSYMMIIYDTHIRTKKLFVYDDLEESYMCQRRRAIIYDQSYVLKCSYTNTLVTHIWYMNMIILCTYMTVGMWLHASVDTYMIHINHHIRTPVYTFLVQFLEAHIWLSTIIICLYSYDHMRTYMICTYMTHIAYMIHIYEYTRIWHSYMGQFPLVMDSPYIHSCDLSSTFWTNSSVRSCCAFTTFAAVCSSLICFAVFVSSFASSSSVSICKRSNWPVWISSASFLLTDQSRFCSELFDQFLPNLFF